MKKKISVFLAFVILLLNIDVMAEKAIEATSEVISEIDLIQDYEIIPTEEIEDEMHTEEIPADYVYPFEMDLEDEGFDMRQPIEEEDGGMSLFSTRATDSKTLWDIALLEQFSEDYLMPFEEKGGEQISGVLNRLMYRVTDLALEGKNGLNLNIIRKFDSQDYEHAYYGAKCGTVENPILFHIYPFTMSDSEDEILIGFYSKDEYYMYMSMGANISELPENTITVGDCTFYDFEDIYDEISGSGEIYLEPIPNRDFINKTEYRETIYELTDKRLLPLWNTLGAGWKFEMPYSISYRDSKTKTNGNEYDTYVYENSGVFADINGNIYSYTNDATYQENNSDYSMRSYSVDFDCDADYMSFQNFFVIQTLEPYEIEYNMTVQDKSSGLTYYLYNTNGVIATRQMSRTVAIVDEFGNAIRYYYNDDWLDLVKIIDTYNREINFNQNGISYTDPESGQIRTIGYSVETLPGTVLDNGSLLTTKPVERLTVTNELGEDTIYDSRKSEGIAAYKTTSSCILEPEPSYYNYSTVVNNDAYDLERIVYPNGKETHYRYENYYYGIYGDRTTKNIHAVAERYDIDNGNIVNQIEYTFSEDEKIGVRSDNTNFVSKFDTYGRKTRDVIRGGTYDDLKSESYQYDSDDNVKQITTKVGSTISRLYRVFSSRYRISLEYDDQHRIDYDYDTYGSTPQRETHKRYSAYDDDFYIETTKLEGTGKVEYERVIKNEEIKSQKKYEYDDFGNVIAIYTWTEDTNADGVLDESDKYVLINGNHSVTDKNTHSYTNFAENVLNADDENTGNISITVENNIFGSPVSQKDSYNNETRVEYDVLNRPIRYIAPNGAERTIEYDNINNTAILTDENGIKIKYIYNSLGNITEKQKYHNGEYVTFEEYTYDSVGMPDIVKVISSDGVGTISDYAHDGLGRVTEIKVYDLENNLIRTESTSYSGYSDYFKIKKNVTGADGTTIATSEERYDPYGNLIEEHQRANSTSYIKEYSYDYRNRLTDETDAKGNTSVRYTYDTLGNILTTKDAGGNITTFEYDLGSRLTSQTDALGNTSEFFYDGLSRKVKEVLPFDGDIKSVNKTYYDKNSNVIKQAVQNNAPGEAEHFKITEFKYDAMGNVLASIGKDAGGDSVVQYEYNLANKPTKMITGLSEYSESQTGGNVTSYTYEDGFLKEITDPLGQSESYTYDWLGNMLTKTDRNEVNHTYTYGIYGLEETTAGNLKTTTAYDNLGRVTSQAQYEDNTLTDSISYTYDAFGRLSKETQGNIERAYTYDANNNKTSYTLKENGEQKTQNTYSYNALNQLTSQTIDDTILTYQYNPLGNIISKQVGNLQATYTYNAGQHLTGLTNQNGEIQYSGYTYAYQLDGNRTNETDTSGIQKSYSYDDLGRLTTEAITGSDITQSMAYTYDNRGNRLTKTENGALTSYTYDANNRLMSEVSDNDSTSYYYDENGNTVSKSIGTFATEGEPSVSVTNTALNLTAYDYDALNRLTSITSGENATSYTYGVNNLRKSKTENNTTIGYVWNGQNMVAETAGNTIQKIHNYALDGIALTTQGEENSFYIKNAHGDVTATADTNGNVSSSYLYDAFGNQLSDNENDTNPFRYCGEYFDEESEMIYLRNRYYSPSNGRFITEDPIKDGLNWYVYCGGNPVMLIDSVGLWMEGDENLSQPAQLYTTYYGQKWEDAYSDYQLNMASGNVSGADAAKLEMDRLHTLAEEIRDLDSQGLVQGNVLDVPVYDQYNTYPYDDSNQLCWATSQAMITSYYLGDNIDRTEHIATYTNAFILPLNGSPIYYNESQVWISTHKLQGYLGLTQEQVSENKMLLPEEVANTIGAGNPFGVLYRDSYSGHWIVAVGYAQAEEHEFLIASNNPAGGISNIERYDDFRKLPDGREWEWTAK